MRDTFRKHAALAGVLLLLMGGVARAQQGAAMPDAPTPQPAGSESLGDLKETVKPGAANGTPANGGSGNQAAGQTSSSSSSSSSSSATPDQSAAPPGPTPDQQEAPDIPPPGQGPVQTLVIPVNEVLLSVTIRDKKGAMVPAIDSRRFRVFEDGVRQRIVFFTTDPFPLSVAFVVDQSLPADVMNRVNESLAAVTGAFTPADSVAVFGYNSSPKMITDFTGAQGARLSVALNEAKAPGRDMGVPQAGGPMDNGIMINGKPVDPNTTTGGSTGGITTPIFPKEYHPLNDAVLAAAVELAKQPRGRRRILYIISDGKEQGSKASYKEVVRYLLSNNISVYGTLVGDSAIWGLGYLDKFHIPLVPTVRDNILPKYALATGGTLDSEVSENGMQLSFSKIVNGVRDQYTLGYVSHANVLASRFHTTEVRVEGIPNLDIIAPDGYYPSAHNSNTASR